MPDSFWLSALSYQALVTQVGMVVGNFISLMLAGPSIRGL
jgi:hypothetical protein